MENSDPICSDADSLEGEAGVRRLVLTALNPVGIYRIKWEKDTITSKKRRSTLRQISEEVEQS